MIKFLYLTHRWVLLPRAKVEQGGNCNEMVIHILLLNAPELEPRYQKVQCHLKKHSMVGGLLDAAMQLVCGNTHTAGLVGC